MMFKNKNSSGFTLIEFLIYISVFVVAAGLLITILVTTTRVENVEIVSTQVGQELNLILTTVQRLVRDASLIECVGPDQDNCDNTSTPKTLLRLRFEDKTKDPTCIYLDNGVVKLAEGPNPEKKEYCNTAAATNLTTTRVNANSLTFTKFDIIGGHATVQIDAQLTFKSDNPELQISRTLRSAVGRVSAATFDSDLLPNVDSTSPTTGYSIGLSSPSRRWKDVYVGNLLGLGTSTADLQSSTPGTIYYNTGRKNIRVLVDQATGWIDAGYWQGSESDIYYNAGNVGIGTTMPVSKLGVSGGVQVGQAPTMRTTLSAALNPIDTTATVVSTSGYPSSGILHIKGSGVSELIGYTGTTSTTFTGLTRGTLGTPAFSHASGASVDAVLLVTTNTSTTQPSLLVRSGGGISIGGTSIGTLGSSEALLTLTSSATNLAQIYLLNVGGGPSWGIKQNLSGVSFEEYPSGSRLFLQDGGNVGIGTTSPGELLSLGLAGTTKGVLSLAGNTSGKIIIQPAANAGTYTLTLPTGVGSSGQFLQTDGTGITSWAAASGGGPTYLSSASCNNTCTVPADATFAVVQFSCLPTTYSSYSRGTGTIFRVGMTSVSVDLNGYPTQGTTNGFQVSASWSGDTITIDGESTWSKNNVVYFYK